MPDYPRDPWNEIDIAAYVPVLNTWQAVPIADGEGIYELLSFVAFRTVGIVGNSLQVQAATITAASGLDLIQNFPTQAHLLAPSTSAIPPFFFNANCRVRLTTGLHLNLIPNAFGDTYTGRLRLRRIF